MTVRRRLARAALIFAGFVLGSWALLSLDGTRRFLIEALDKTPAPAAAAEVEALPATFDGPDEARERLAVRLVPVITGVAMPTDVAAVPGRTDRAVVLSKAGQLADLSTGAVSPWFAVEVATTSELGLLGIAFHPKFTENGLFFVNATPSLGGRRAATRVSRWQVDPATLAAPRELGVVLELEQPYQNHDAGQLAFGPDGRLYVGFGDGGFRGDPLGSGQDTSTWLGSMLRIDVDAPGVPYAVPPDNPLVGVDGARPEIWAWGLRNPWRYSFDPQGRLLVGDVGQDRIEEIDWVRRGDNLGWRIREGDACYDPEQGCRTEGLVEPIWSYPRSHGQSVTGGVVATAPGPLQGRYLFGDFVSGRLWALTVPDERRRVDDVTALGRFDLNPSAFGRAPDGAVWVADFRRGAIFRIEPTGP